MKRTANPAYLRLHRVKSLEQRNVRSGVLDVCGFELIEKCTCEGASPAQVVLAFRCIRQATPRDDVQVPGNLRGMSFQGGTSLQGIALGQEAALDTHAGAHAVGALANGKFLCFLEGCKCLEGAVLFEGDIGRRETQGKAISPAHLVPKGGSQRVDRSRKARSGIPAPE